MLGFLSCGNPSKEAPAQNRWDWKKFGRVESSQSSEHMSVSLSVLLSRAFTAQLSPCCHLMMMADDDNNSSQQFIDFTALTIAHCNYWYCQFLKPIQSNHSDKMVFYECLMTTKHSMRESVIIIAGN
jgi:hypothetical protein